MCVCVLNICSHLTESDMVDVSYQQKSASTSRGLRAGRLTSAAAKSPVLEHGKSKEDVRGLGEEGVCVCVCVLCAC